MKARFVRISVLSLVVAGLIVLACLPGSPESASHYVFHATAIIGG